MSNPAVTVLLPVYNGGGLLRASIESVLRQTFTDFELLIIDDASTDQTPDLLRALRDPRIRLLTNPENLGLTRTLNRGLAEARGELVARQDADDLSASNRLEKQIAFLRNDPGIQLLGSCAWRMNAAGRVTGANDLPTTHEAIRWASVTDNPFLHTSIVFRRAALLAEFGGYDETFSICQDYELWNRVAARHRVANLRDRLVGMREHPGSMTRTQPSDTTTEVRRILDANWKRIFPERPISSEEGDVLELFRLRFSPEKLPRLRQLLDSLLAEFVATQPTAPDSADFRATLCRQSLRLAYKFFRDRPALVLGDLARAFRHSPREWLIQAWTAWLTRRGRRASGNQG